MTHTYASCLYHFVWSTKGRSKTIFDSFEHRLYAYIRSVSEGHNVPVIAINGMPDHVHMLVRVKLTTEIPSFMRDVKASSTRWLRREVPDCQGFSWQEGYGAFTVGHYGYEKVVKYIENQKEHHKHQSFDEEFLGFLKALNISYDPRFVLG